MHLVPSIAFAGNAQAAIDFYCSVFQGEAEVYYYRDFPEVFEGHVPENIAGQVMEATISCSGLSLSVYDSIDQDSESLINQRINLSLILDSFDQARQFFDLLANQGQVLNELESTPFSQGYGLVQDKFSITWEILVS